MGVTKSAISRILDEDRNLTIKKIAEIFYHLGEDLEVITRSELDELKNLKRKKPNQQGNLKLT